MSDELQSLIEMARQIPMTSQELEEQRISFAYGNTHYEDDRITRDQVVLCSRLLSELAEPPERSHS